MSKPNGSKPIQRLAAALRPPQDELAAALQECLDSAVERGAERAKEAIREEFGPRFDRIDERLDRQDKTLRKMWRQRGGSSNERLPIDD